MNKFIGKVGYISEKKIVQRALKDDIVKITVEVISDTGEVVFFELRDNSIILLENNQISPGDTVEVFYQFKGSRNGITLYNNIVVTDMNLIAKST